MIPERTDIAPKVSRAPTKVTVDSFTHSAGEKELR